jgi:2,3-bisphosphoglycerate-dependent phosphoglycerate mutase
MVVKRRHTLLRPLNERDFGLLTGALKSELRKRYRTEEYNLIRRSWATPTPGGESLREVHARVAAYFRQVILPGLAIGRDSIVVGHTNSLRALVIEVEQIPPTRVDSVEGPTHEIWIYRYDQQVRRFDGDTTIIVP